MATDKEIELITEAKSVFQHGFQGATVEEMLTQAIDFIGELTAALEAAEAVRESENTALQEENERLREALEEIRIYTAKDTEYKKTYDIYKIAKQALGEKT